MPSRRLVILAALVLNGACGESEGTPAAPELEPPFYRSRPHIVWSDAPHGFAPGIEGDGRARDGSTSGIRNEYQAYHCGVWGELRTDPGGSGEMAVDFDVQYTSAMAASCGARRSLTFHLGDLGDISPSHVFNLVGLTNLDVGESRSQILQFNLYQALPDCHMVHFNGQWPPVEDARMTRLDDGSGPVRQWRVESQGSHLAQCLRASGGSRVPVGEPIFLPFSFVVTELLYPFETYP